MMKTSHKPPSKPTRCAIYARTATVKQANEDNSIAKQLATCNRLAKRKGWIVRDECIFTDSGKSGLRANVGLKDLLRIATINPKSFDVLLCTAIDRIARDIGLAFRVHRALKKHCVEIRFVDLNDTLL
jgi:DNA invertase Pin-like site-specific DNA recombinase